MTTPILTQKQQRQSISAKKGPVKGLRNILAQPTENHWYVLSDALIFSCEFVIDFNDL